ncbi:MAG: hypothetical protein B7Z80_05825 [Rhodospirillales bacterium 20-64-7]|nr:MAG: hypothetical protein B7Z80_05825 [Rhodospirillales bacterium 20-64-7]
MLERERHKAILSALAEEPVLSAARLMKALDVSAATIRRDITALAQSGAVRRVHGGVEALGHAERTHLVGMPFVQRRAVAGGAKRAIARAAAAMLGAGERLAISGGSTTAYLVEYLSAGRRDILTNSMPVAVGLAGSANRVSLPGGAIYPDQSMVLSPFTDPVIEHFHADTLLTGCHGLDRNGLMEADPLIVQGLTRLMGCAERLVLLADSRKLALRSATIVAPLARIAWLVTDSGATDQELAPLREAGLHITVVDPDP